MRSPLRCAALPALCARSLRPSSQRTLSAPQIRIRNAHITPPHTFSPPQPLSRQHASASHSLNPPPPSLCPTAPAARHGRRPSLGPRALHVRRRAQAHRVARQLCPQGAVGRDRAPRRLHDCALGRLAAQQPQAARRPRRHPVGQVAGLLRRRAHRPARPPRVKLPRVRDRLSRPRPDQARADPHHQHRPLLRVDPRRPDRRAGRQGGGRERGARDCRRLRAAARLDLCAGRRRALPDFRPHPPRHGPRRPHVLALPGPPAAERVFALDRRGRGQPKAAQAPHHVHLPRPQPCLPLRLCLRGRGQAGDALEGARQARGGPAMLARPANIPRPRLLVRRQGSRRQGRVPADRVQVDRAREPDGGRGRGRARAQEEQGGDGRCRQGQLGLEGRPREGCGTAGR